MQQSYKDLFRDGLDRFVTSGSIALWIVVIYYAFTQLMPRAQYGVLFLGFVLTVWIIEKAIDDIEEDNRLQLTLLLASMVVVLYTTTYVFTNFEVLNVVRVGYALQHEKIMALAFILTMIYITWRSYGITFLWIVLLGIFYGHFGYLFPGIIGHGGLSLDRLSLILVLEIEGFYGFLNRIMAAWVALFLLFAGLLEAYGAFNLIFRIASKTTDYIDSGIAQTAVVSSSIIGMVNGSQTANAAMTGSFTIPLMKKNGMKASTAAGIEAVASTSGQVLPPVMGAGAFIMASLLGITYTSVILAAAVPAAILMITILFAVHIVAIHQLDSTASMDEVLDGTLPLRKKVSEAFRFGVPMAVLIWALGIVQYTVMTSALYAVITMLATGILFPVVTSAYNIATGKKPYYREEALSGTSEDGERKKAIDFNESSIFQTLPSGIQRVVRFRPISELLLQLRNTVWGFRRGALVAAPVAIILASINGVVDILITTGVPSLVTLALMNISSGILIIAGIISMIICIILGLGMPTTAAYTIVALLVAPTLVSNFQMPDLAAHLFVFYAAILAGLTPPIATAVAAASGVANSGFWESSKEAIKISAPLFILPFGFLYHPYVVDGVFDAKTLMTGGIVLIGSLAIVYGINNRFGFSRSTSMLFKVGYTSVGLITMAYHSTMGQFIGISVIVAMVIAQHWLANDMKLSIGLQGSRRN